MTANETLFDLRIESPYTGVHRIITNIIKNREPEGETEKVNFDPSITQASTVLISSALDPMASPRVKSQAST